MTLTRKNSELDSDCTNSRAKNSKMHVMLIIITVATVPASGDANLNPEGKTMYLISK